MYLGTEKRLIDALLEHGKGIPEELQQTPGVILKLLRKRLGMTQAQLAKKAGTSQAKVANIEAEKHQPTLTTLYRLFEALGLRLAFVPISLESADEMIDARADELARKHVEYLQGTMALEEQQLTPTAFSEMVEDEKFRLKEGSLKRLWDEE